MQRREALQLIAATGLILCGREDLQAEERTRKNMALSFWGLTDGFFGEAGVISLEEGALQCEVGGNRFKYPPGGRCYNPEEFESVKRRFEKEGRVSIGQKADEKSFLAIDAEGQVIVTDVLDERAKWEVTAADYSLSRRLLKHFSGKDNEVSVYHVAHQFGHKGKRYLTTAAVESKNDASLKDEDPRRIVLTADKSAAEYLWKVMLSGK